VCNYSIPKLNDIETLSENKTAKAEIFLHFTRTASANHGKTMETIKRKVMKLKNLYFVFFVLVSTSFNIVKLDKSLAFVNDNAAEFHSNFSILTSGDVAYFECEDFVDNALNNYSIEVFSHDFKKTLKCSKEFVVNRHDTSVVDTVYSFSNSKNKIQIYRALHNDFIVTFDVTDAMFKLKGDIKPGMTKTDFFRKFNLTESINNKVQIVNSDGSMNFMFFFENHSLKRINSLLYLD